MLCLSRPCCSGIGGDRVPQFWGKPSPYTEGTAFLGTPPNHEEVCMRHQDDAPRS
jgi:hypothetical protein